jgi:hypothetical protein
MENKEVRISKFKGALLSQYIKWAIDLNEKEMVDAYYANYKAGHYDNLELEPWVLLFFRMKELTIN